MSDDKKQKPSDYKQFESVIYVPYHADGDVNHKDCERGMVSSFNDKFIFVKFYPTLAKLGWRGTTSQGCKVDQLKTEDEAEHE